MVLLAWLLGHETIMATRYSMWKHPVYGVHLVHST